MTPQETIKNLKKLKSFHNGSYGTAIEMAIKALEQTRPKGKWIKQDDHNKVCYGWNYCSNCGAICGEEPNYCSECGAYMKTEEVDKD